MFCHLALNYKVKSLMKQAPDCRVNVIHLEQNIIYFYRDNHFKLLSLSLTIYPSLRCYVSWAIDSSPMQEQRVVWAMVVAPLTEQSIPTPEARGSNPVIGFFNVEHSFTFNWMEKTEKRKRGWDLPIFWRDETFGQCDIWPIIAIGKSKGRLLQGRLGQVRIGKQYFAGVLWLTKWRWANWVT